MNKQIIEILELIADGGLDHEDILAMTAEVMAAQQDPEAYRARHEAGFYPLDAAIPLWETVLLEQLEDGLLFKADTVADLYAQISDAFGENELDLAAESLTGLTDISAIKAIQDELNPNYTLVDFSVSKDRQLVLIRTHYLANFLKLCKELNIQAESTFENLFNNK
ncbi:MAG: hypothetical protein ACRC01_07000 [Deefgea sp.]